MPRSFAEHSFGSWIQNHNELQKAKSQWTDAHWGEIIPYGNGNWHPLDFASVLRAYISLCVTYGWVA